MCAAWCQKTTRPGLVCARTQSPGATIPRLRVVAMPRSIDAVVTCPVRWQLHAESVHPGEDGGGPRGVSSRRGENLLQRECGETDSLRRRKLIMQMAGPGEWCFGVFVVGCGGSGDHMPAVSLSWSHVPTARCLPRVGRGRRGRTTDGEHHYCHGHIRKRGLVRCQETISVSRRTKVLNRSRFVRAYT